MNNESRKTVYTIAHGHISYCHPVHSGERVYQDRWSTVRDGYEAPTENNNNDHIRTDYIQMLKGNKRTTSSDRH